MTETFQERLGGLVGPLDNVRLLHLLRTTDTWDALLLDSDGKPIWKRKARSWNSVECGTEATLGLHDADDYLAMPMVLNFVKDEPLPGAGEEHAGGIVIRPAHGGFEDWTLILVRETPRARS